MVDEEGPLQIVLFRRDIRLDDHEPLTKAIEAASPNGRLVPLWVYDPSLLKHESSSTSHYLFIDQCLDALDQQLLSMGSGLVYRSGLLTGVLAQLLQLSGGRISMWSHRVTGHSADRARDLQTAAWCEQHGVVWHQVATGGVFAGSTMTRFEDWQERWQPLFVNYCSTQLIPAPTALPPLPEGIKRGRRLTHSAVERLGADNSHQITARRQ